MKRLKRLILLSCTLIFLSVFVLGLYGYAYLDDAIDAKVKRGAGNATEEVARGAYLAAAGNCMACHTGRGGAAFAGGRAMQTEFGQFVTPNITSDKIHGIGLWTADDFWNALHNGKSKDGRLLYPAFPFVNYTHITREDSDSLFSYFQTIAPISRKNETHALRFPYDQRWLLAYWRALYFRPGTLKAEPQQSAQWNRGAYLIRGLGHCSACHSSRNSLGATQGSADFSGGEMSMLKWFAPSLLSTDKSGIAHSPSEQVEQLLQHGINAQRSINGPMAEVVSESLQHLSAQDISAMATYLQALPLVKLSPPDLLDQALAPVGGSKRELERVYALGGKLYTTHCVDCHGADGKGKAGIYPALQGNPTIQQTSLSNPLRLILSGGFAATTHGNPRPYSMPPFAPFLDDTEVALVLSYIRNSWGNQGSVVTASEVNPYRTAPLD